MGIYKKYLFPRIIELILSKPSVTEYRKDILAHVNGNILEIGFGTGLNLPCYPDWVKHITVIDNNAGMNLLAQKRVKLSNIEVDLKLLNAEILPFDDETFDSLVSTFTFCSIDKIDFALKEFHRVLKPDGKLILLEHGLSANNKLGKLQHYINPFYKLFSDGCNLDRNIKDIVERNNFKFDFIEQFYSKDMIKLSGYLYKGIASRRG